MGTSHISDMWHWPFSSSISPREGAVTQFPQPTLTLDDKSPKAQEPLCDVSGCPTKRHDTELEALQKDGNSRGSWADLTQG